jgi:hypothetical protein
VRNTLATFLLALAPLEATAVSNNLTYYGGPVVANAQVVLVNWGTNVPSAVQADLPTFYGDIVQSDYWTILGEYSTNMLGSDGQPGSDQNLGFGSFVATYTISPTLCGGTTACTITDTQIDVELAHQISISALPAPTPDSTGNVNTVYMVHFAPGVTINQQGTLSCQQFCATFSTFSSGSLQVTAGFIPDQGGACMSGCGGGANTYIGVERWTSLYILTNIVTNPLAGGAPTVGRPLAWYNTSLGDVADICNSGSDLSTVVANGNSYGVAKLWSNKFAACISNDNKFVVKPSASAHGSINPNAPQAVASGQTVTFSVSPDATYIAAVGGTCGGELIGATYVTDAITGDCTVLVIFIDRIFSDGFE